MSAFGNSPLVLGGNSLAVASGTSPVGTLGITDDQVAVGATTANTIEGSANFTFGLANGLRLSSSVTGGAQLYNTADQTTNYERLEAVWSGSEGFIRTAIGGSGTARPLNIGARDSVSGVGPLIRLLPGSRTITFYAYVDSALANSATSANLGFRFTGMTNTATSGTITPVTITPIYNQVSGTAANTDLLINRTETAVGSGGQFLIQAQVGGSDRFSVSNAGTLTVAASVIAGASSFFIWSGRSRMSSAADGRILLANAASTDFSLLQFGGTTSSFPALKRSTTELQVRLADDSAYGYITAKLRASDAAAGANFSGAVTNITVVDGVVTAVS